MFLCVYFIAGFGAMSGWWHDGTVTNITEWPKVLHSTIGKHPEAIDDIRVYEMFTYFDHKSIWWIDGRTELVDDFISQHDLDQSTSAHPMADQLLKSIPSNWQKPNLNYSEWYATPEFGSIHIESQDLFLLVIDRNQKTTIVLYHWIF